MATTTTTTPKPLAGSPCDLINRVDKLGLTVYFVRIPGRILRYMIYDDDGEGGYYLSILIQQILTILATFCGPEGNKL